MKKKALLLSTLVLMSALTIQSANAGECPFCKKLKFWEKKAPVAAPAKTACPCAAKPAVKTPAAPAKPACPCAKPAVKTPVKK